MSRQICVNVDALGTIVSEAYKSELGLNDEQIEGTKVRVAATTPSDRTLTPLATAADGWWAVERGFDKIVHSRDGLAWDNDHALLPESLPGANLHWIVGPDGL